MTVVLIIFLVVCLLAWIDGWMSQNTADIEELERQDLEKILNEKDDEDDDFWVGRS